MIYYELSVIFYFMCRVFVIIYNRTRNTLVCVKQFRPGNKQVEVLILYFIY